jgi:hypothetical protein
MLDLEANSSSECHTDSKTASEGDGRIGSRREASEAASAPQMSRTPVEGIRAAPQASEGSARQEEGEAVGGGSSPQRRVSAVNTFGKRGRWKSRAGWKVAHSVARATRSFESV